MVAYSFSLSLSYESKVGVMRILFFFLLQNLHLFLYDRIASKYGFPRSSMVKCGIPDLEVLCPSITGSTRSSVGESGLRQDVP